jgi:hypothetical protein
MDYTIIYFLKNFAFSPPSWTVKIPLGGLLFLGVTLFLLNMSFAYIFKFILKPFRPAKFALVLLGIISLLNFVFLLKVLWAITPNFSFWNIITFIMCVISISGPNILFVGFLGVKEDD